MSDVELTLRAEQAEACLLHDVYLCGRVGVCSERAALAWLSPSPPPPTQGHHLPDRAGLGEEGRVLQVGPGPGYVPGIHNQSPS